MFLRKRRTGQTRVDELTALCRALLSERGEISGARLARDVIATYQSLDPASRDAFFDGLVTAFSPDAAAVQAAAEAYHREPSQGKLVHLQAVVESPRQELFRRWNMA